MIKITMEVKREDIIESVRMMSDEKREDFLEELLAATSPEYLRSIKEARNDYKAGRVKAFKGK